VLNSGRCPCNGRMGCFQPIAAIDQNPDESEATAIDIETGPDCGGTLRVIACIEEPALIARILGHVQQHLESDNKLARAPPGH
jgi:hypothetical protein